MRKKILKKLIQNISGFTMTEMLCVTAIMVMVSGCLVVGMNLCNNTLRTTKQFAEMQMLSSTLTASITDELRYAKDITASGGVITYVSDRHGKNTSLSCNANGQVVLTSTIDSEYPLLGSSAYFGSSINDLSFSYNSTTKNISVSFKIIAKDGTNKNTSFMVKTLNG